MSKRDYALARMAVAISAIDTAKDRAEAAVTHFIATDEDQDGTVREELMNLPLGECHNAAVALQQALNALGEMNEQEVAESEDDDEPDAEEESDEDAR